MKEGNEKKKRGMIEEKDRIWRRRRINIEEEEEEEERKRVESNLDEGPPRYQKYRGKKPQISEIIFQKRKKKNI